MVLLSHLHFVFERKKTKKRHCGMGMVKERTISTHWFFSWLDIIYLRTHLENIIPFAHISIVNLRAIPKALVRISRNGSTLFFMLNQLFIFHSETGSFLHWKNLFVVVVIRNWSHSSIQHQAPRAVLWTKWFTI